MIGDGVEDALAGHSGDRDALAARAALAEAQRAFGALDCTARDTRRRRAVAIACRAPGGGPGRARAAARVDVRAAVRGSRAATSTRPRSRRVALRALGGAPTSTGRRCSRSIPRSTRSSNRDMMPVEIKADVAGADVWIDFQRAGTAPLKVALAAGDHVIAAATGTRRGWAAGTAGARRSRSIDDPDCATRPGTWSALAARVAAGTARCRRPSELAWVLDARSHARIALVRHGDTVEAWGRVGARASRCTGSAARTAIARSPRRERLSRSSPIACRRGTTARPIPISRCSSRRPRERAARPAGEDRDEPTQVVGLRDDRRRARRRRGRDLRARQRERHASAWSCTYP